MSEPSMTEGKKKKIIRNFESEPRTTKIEQKSGF